MRLGDEVLGLQGGGRPGHVRESGRLVYIVGTCPGQVGLRNVLAFLGPIFSSICFVIKIK